MGFPGGAEPRDTPSTLSPCYPTHLHETEMNEAVKIKKLVLLAPQGATLTFMHEAAVASAVQNKTDIEFEHNDRTFLCRYAALLKCVVEQE